MVLLRYAVRVNGLSELALTKLDILSGLDNIKICTAYQQEGTIYEELPMGPAHLEDFQAEYEELPGWENDLTSIRYWKDLPKQAQYYIKAIESHIGIPVTLISVGPERSQVVSR
jgi:adenylosuccinate synthase